MVCRAPRKWPGPFTTSAMTSTDRVSSETSIPRAMRRMLESMSSSMTIASNEHPRRLASIPADS